jgi:hypothetical protein
MMTDIKRLEELINKMPGLYEDVPKSTLTVAKRYNCTEELISYLEANPQATPSDLQYYITENVWKIPNTPEYDKR